MTGIAYEECGRWGGGKESGRVRDSGNKNTVSVYMYMHAHVATPKGLVLSVGSLQISHETTSPHDIT